MTAFKTFNLISIWAFIVTIIVNIITLITSKKKTIKNNKLTKANIHIELRKLFSEKNRFNVHLNLRPGGKWSNNNLDNLTNEEWGFIDDYLGLFEVCETMLSDKILDKDLFE